MKLKTWLILGISFFPLLYFAFQANHIPYPPNSDYSDFAITHYPNLVYLQDSIRQYGQVPLWSNAILGGYPYDANPLSSLWYPPYWASVIFPAQIGLNVLVIAHLVWGAAGMYSYLLLLNHHRFGAFMAAMAFMWMPKIFAHWGAGHVTLVWAVCWTPWLLYSMRGQFSNEKIKRTYPGIILGLIFLADPRWIVWAGSLYIIYSCYVYLTKNPLKRTFFINNLTGLFLQLGTTLILALLVSAPLLLPLAQYTSLSTRAMMDISSQLLYSLPVNHLLGVIIPDFGGFSEWISYFGIVPLFGMIYGVAHRRIRPKIWLWVAGFIICFLVAIGDQTPIASVIMRLPVFEWQRIPTRILFLAGVFSAVILSNVISEILKDEDESGFDPIFFLVIPTIFLVLLFLGIQLVNKEISNEFIWATIVAVLGVLIFRLFRKNKKKVMIILLGFLMLFDLIGSDIQMIEFRSLENVFTPKNKTTQLLSESGELFRVYSPSYSIPQEIAAIERIQLLDGIDPMQLRQTVDYMEAAAGIPMDQYSVTMPPFKTGNPEVDNQDFLPDARLLGKMNVKYVVSEFPIHSKGLNLINSSGIPYVYQNRYFLPRIYLMNDNHNVDQVDVRYYSPNQITISSDRAGTIVFADVMYPGWICKVDGVPIPLKSYDGLFRSVIVNDGNHIIELNYRPVLLYIGLAVSVVTWVLLVAILLYYFKKKKHHVV